MNRKITFLLFLLSITSAVAQDLTFTDKADKPIARSGAASSKDAQDNNIYVANGFSATDSYTSEIEKYNIEDNTWSLFPTSVPTIGKRYGNMEIFINTMYLLNGVTENGLNNKLEMVNLNNGNLTVSATLNPNPVYGGGSSIWGDYLITFGGCANKFNAIYSNKLYKITPWGDWYELAEMPVGLETKGEVIYGFPTSKLYVFGGYNETNKMSETFQTVTAGSPISLTDWVNLTETGTKYYKGALFSGNTYAQITAFDAVEANQEPSNISWLISGPITASGTNPVLLNFATKDGYNNGAVLQAYLITNWTGDIFSSTTTLLDANISGGSTAGYAANFTDSGDVLLSGDLTEFRIGFKYTGGYSPLATTTYQVDNVRVFQPAVSNNIYVYDFSSDSWTTSATTLPLSLSAYAIARDDVSNTRLYITGDYYNQTFTGVYDTTNDTFTTLTQANMIGRRHHNSEFHNNNLYILGGNTVSASSSVLSSTQSTDLSMLGTGNLISDSGVKMYPNPATDVLYFSEPVSNISIFTIDGRAIATELSNNGVNVSGLPAGVYVLRGEGFDGKTFEKKLVIN